MSARRVLVRGEDGAARRPDQVSASRSAACPRRLADRVVTASVAVSYAFSFPGFVLRCGREGSASTLPTIAAIQTANRLEEAAMRRPSERVTPEVRTSGVHGRRSNAQLPQGYDGQHSYTLVPVGRLELNTTSSESR